MLAISRNLLFALTSFVPTSCRSHCSLLADYPRRDNEMFLSPQRYPMLTMCRIWEISSEAFCQLMCMPDIAAPSDTMHFSYAVQTNMERQRKPKPFRTAFLAKNFAANIMRCIKMSTSGLASIWTILDAPPRPCKPKLHNRFIRP